MGLDSFSKSKRSDEISNAVINRLPKYYRCLRELLNNDILRVSSKELAGLMRTTASQIRQDFNCFGGFGQQGYGYSVKTLYTKIGMILGITDNYSAVIIGAGGIGMILADNPVFTKRGVILRGVFDKLKKYIGKEINSELTVRSIKDLEQFLLTTKIDIAVFVDYELTKSCVDILLRNKIKGIWNFTGHELRDVDDTIPIENMYIEDTLMTLCYQIKQKEE